jgi:hypothetical protein
VQVGLSRGQAEARPLPVDEQQGGDLAQPGLDRSQPDQLPVQPVEHAVDSGLPPRRPQVDGGIVGEPPGRPVLGARRWRPAGGGHDRGAERRPGRQSAVAHGLW